MKIRYKIKHKSPLNIQEDLEELESTTNELNSLINEIDELSEEEVSDIIDRSILLINMFNNFLEADIISETPNNAFTRGIALGNNASFGHATILQAPEQESSKETLLSIINKAITVAHSIETSLLEYQNNPNQEAYFDLDDGDNDDSNNIEEFIQDNENNPITIINGNEATNSHINFEPTIIERAPSIIPPSHISSIFPINYISPVPFPNNHLLHHHPLYREFSQESSESSLALSTTPPLDRQLSVLSSTSLAISTPGKEGPESP